MYKVQKYMYTYLKSVSVLPPEHLVDKFNYFYSGYNFQANTKMYMEFDAPCAQTLSTQTLDRYQKIKQLSDRGPKDDNIE